MSFTATSPSGNRLVTCWKLADAMADSGGGQMATWEPC